MSSLLFNTGFTSDEVRKMNCTVVANWLFLIGSALFTLDSAIEVSRSLSIHSVFSILACLAFTIGCILFLVATPSNNYFNSEV